MDYEAFYDQLFRPIETTFGKLDPNTIFHIMGFDCGGPLNFSTVGVEATSTFVTYVSCELAVRDEQVASSDGRFELMCHSNDEDWVRLVLTSVGRLSLEAQLDHGHTVDVSQIVPDGATLRGIVLERFAAVQIDRADFCILRVHGITEAEMQIVREQGAEMLFEKLRAAGVYPNTDIHRAGVA